MPYITKLSGLTLPGSGYPNIADFAVPVLPVTSGLVGLYLLGGGKASLVTRNFAPGGSPATIVGLPTYNARSMILSQNNCLDTGLPETEAVTFLTVAKPIGSGGGSINSTIYVGNYREPAAAAGVGASIFSSGASPRVAVSHGSAPGTVVTNTFTLTGLVPDQAQVFGGICTGASGTQKAAWGRGGVLSFDTADVTTTRSLAARTLRVGGHYATDGSFTGTHEGYLAAIYNRGLSDSEFTQNYNYLRPFFGTLGITTL